MRFSLAETFAAPQKPILRLFGLPVDATLAILLTHVCTMVVLALFTAWGPGVEAGSKLAGAMVFDSASFRGEEFMCLFLYPFRHDILSVHLLFVVEMVLFFFCGRGLENLIGRKAMIFYYGVLMVLPPLLLAALSRVLPIGFVLESSFHLTVSLCLSYLLFVPHPAVQGGFHLRLMTWLMIGFCAVFFVAKKDWQILGYMAVSLTVSLLYLESIGAGSRAGILYLFRRLPLAHAEGRGQGRIFSAVPAERGGVQESVDVLLEKISRHGMDSLTSEERLLLVEAGKRLTRNE